MNKQEQIEAMAEIICSQPHSCAACDFEGRPCGYQEFAIALIDAGYGNIERALTEFAARLRAKFVPTETIGGCWEIVRFKTEEEVYSKIDQTLQEYLNSLKNQNQGE